MPRPVLLLFVIMLAALATGVPAAASEYPGQCSDGCSDETGQEGAGDHDPDCAPFCHACPCFAPMLAASATSVVYVAEPEGLVTVWFVSTNPTAPPPQDVFHPPRHSA